MNDGVEPSSSESPTPAPLLDADGGTLRVPQFHNWNQLLWVTLPSTVGFVVFLQIALCMDNGLACGLATICFCLMLWSGVFAPDATVLVTPTRLTVRRRFHRTVRLDVRQVRSVTITLRLETMGKPPKRYTVYDLEVQTEERTLLLTGTEESLSQLEALERFLLAHALPGTSEDVPEALRGLRGAHRSGGPGSIVQ